VEERGFELKNGSSADAELSQYLHLEKIIILLCLMTIKNFNLANH
jgi:hypothetical protein